MPWCPQCRAEYVEGIATCRACGVTLVEELPAAPAGGGAKPKALGVALRALSQFPLGLRYAREAFRLLRHKPGLLWLPLLVVCFNTAEIALGNYLGVTVTAAGRRMKAEERKGRQPSFWNQQNLRAQLAPGRVAHKAALTALEEFPVPLPGPGLRGLQWTVLMAAEPADSSRHFPKYWGALTFLSALVLVVALVALFLSGYYGLLTNATGALPSGQGVFGASLKANYWRFLGYLAAMLAARRGLVYLSGFLPVGESDLWTRLYLFAHTWAAPLLLAPFALGPVAITLDRVGVLRAARRSAKTVLRGLPVCLVLLALFFLVLVPVQIYQTVVATRVLSRGFFSAQAVAGNAAQSLVAGAAFALLGVWLCLAQFLWYREANPAPVVPTETGETTPA